MTTPIPRKRLRNSFAINVAGAVIPLVVALVTVPMYVAHIGEARYGVMSIVWVLLGYFGFLDLGLSRAASNSLAKISPSEHAERSSVLVTSIVLNLCMAVIGTVILIFASGYLLQSVLSVPDNIKPEIASAIPWIACLLPLALVQGVGIGAIESRENFLTANILQVFGTTFGQVVPVLFAVFVSPSLSVVIPAAALSRGFSVLLVLFVVYHTEKPLRLRDFDRQKARSLLGYGGWITVSSVVTPFLNTLDQVVIGRVLGVSSVTYYSVPMNLVMRSQLITNALARTLFPRLSSSSRADATLVAERSMIVSAILYAGFCSTGIIFLRPFLTLWINPGFSDMAGGLGVILLVGAWVNALTFAPYALLQGQGRPDLTAKLHLAQALPYFALLYVLTHQFGLLGAAAAFAIRSVFDFVILVLISPMQRSCLAKLLPTFALLLASCAAEYLLRDNLAMMFVYGVFIWLAVTALTKFQEGALFDQIMELGMAALRRRTRS